MVAEVYHNISHLHYCRLNLNSIFFIKLLHDLNVVVLYHPSKPIQHLITLKKYEKVQDQYFSFMNPLAVEIWLYIVVAYILVSLTMWIVARFSPFEWQIKNESEESWLNTRTDNDSMKAGCSATHQCNRHQNNHQNDINSIDDVIHEESDTYENNKVTKRFSRAESMDSLNGSECVDDRNLNYPDLFSGTKEYLSPQRQSTLNNENCFLNEIHEFIENELQSAENDFTLRNSFWFAIGTLMQQGDLNPKVFF